MTQIEIESLNALIGANIDKGLQDKYLQMVVKLGKAEARLKVYNDKLTKARSETSLWPRKHEKIWLTRQQIADILFFS